MRTAGGSQSGKPCARLIALYCVAISDIPRMTDSEKTEVRCEVLGMKDYVRLEAKGQRRERLGNSVSGLHVTGRDARPCASVPMTRNQGSPDGRAARPYRGQLSRRSSWNFQLHPRPQIRHDLHHVAVGLVDHLSLCAGARGAVVARGDLIKSFPDLHRVPASGVRGCRRFGAAWLGVGLARWRGMRG